ncbi:MAG: hypothetical protein M1830_006843 [Pleopsidium flavum]|nr:MAG: hypothetical protein M1830_006978 [Pleopsidium flavum]KAI9876285.1 MAG: hypothetical protein M1830_006843 [Pleopsidium flavum]
MHKSLQLCLSQIFEQPISSPLKIPHFLVPSAVFSGPPLHASTRRQPARVRLASSNAIVRRLPVSSIPRAQRSRPSDIAAEVPTSLMGSCTEPDAWLALLEPYLPATLRSSTASFLPKSRPRLANGVPDIFLQARQQRSIDLLSYLGVARGRWQAVLWLVKNIADAVPATAGLGNAESSLSRTPWRGDVLLDVATQSAVGADWEIKRMEWKTARLPSLDDLTRDSVAKSSSVSVRDVALRQIWQSTGSMILEAADRSEHSAQTIMSNVYQIIAHLHHIGAVPDTIYDYAPADDPSVLQRPPTLYLLSARILTTLSDAVWRAREKEVTAEAAAVGAEFSYKGYELPSARYKLRVRELEPAVWLDFVLWACVESGYVTEGAWILGAMKRREDDKRWSTIGWKVLQDPPLGSEAKAARVDWDGIRSRTGEVLSRIEGYSDERPFVEMGSRTISSEVVAALIDGLLNTVQVSPSNRVNTASKIQEEIHSLKAILEHDSFGPTPRAWNSIILRLLESHDLDPEVDAAALERALALAPVFLRGRKFENHPADQDSLSLTSDTLSQSALALGLFHRTLHAFALQGNIRGSHRLFARIQSFVESNKKGLRPDSVEDLKRRMRVESGGIDSVDEAATGDFLESFPNIPVPVLAAFFDLITDAKAYEFGRWLLYSKQTGAQVVRFFSNPVLAPALLRYAAATSDTYLLEKLSAALVPPLQEKTIRASFHCLVTLHKWEGAEEILRYFKEEREVGWSGDEAMALAKAVLLLEQPTHLGSQASESAPQTRSLRRAKELLEKLLRGDYNTIQMASQPQDHSQPRLLRQLIRIFRRVPGTLKEICQDLPDHSAQVSAPIDIPTSAFNLFLAAIVKTQGSFAGKKLWDMWCRDPNIVGKHRKPDDGILVGRTASPRVENAPTQWEPGKVVVPNLATLRTIVQVTVQERKRITDIASESFHQNRALGLRSRSYRPVDILDWAAVMFRKFGLNEQDINAELGGYLYRQARSSDKERQFLVGKNSFLCRDRADQGRTSAAPMEHGRNGQSIGATT